MSQEVMADDELEPVEGSLTPAESDEVVAGEEESPTREANGDDLSDLFEPPSPDDPGMDTDDLFEVTEEDVMGDDPDMSDLLDVSREDIIGSRPMLKRPRRRVRKIPHVVRPYEVPPTSLGGIDA